MLESSGSFLRARKLEGRKLGSKGAGELESLVARELGN